jgi:oligoribonuclease NrnB/cAMP/cGMP phosphodiesterase (DHH superfamily)
MADCSLPVDDMIHIASISHMFYWFDHHISAIQSNLPALSPYIDQGKVFTFTDIKMAGCELVWMFFNGLDNDGVKLLATYDAWRNGNMDEWENRVLPFQYGLRTFKNSLDPMSEIWGQIGNKDFTKQVIDIGTHILQYEREQHKLACTNGAFECSINEDDLFDKNGNRYKAIALCTHARGSQMFDSIYDPNKHDVMLPFKFDGTQWLFSIYSTKENIDCSVIARKFKGGGHTGASGFKTDTIPYWLKKENK